MTHPDSHAALATLIRGEVTATEPTHALDARIPVRLGRRRLHARRMRVAVVAAAVVAVAGVAAPLALGNGNGNGNETSAPTTATPWGRQVREALEPSTGELPSVSVRHEGTTVTAGLGAEPGGWHFYTVTADSAGRLDDPAAHCLEMLALGYVSCTVDHDAQGRPVVIQEVLLVNVGARAVTGIGHTWDLSYARMPIDHLDYINPADRFYRREAVAATSSGTLTVAEQVQAPTAADAATAYVVPSEDLVAVASDPDLAEAH